jgi:thioredoxin reductase (NADPH)
VIGGGNSAVEEALHLTRFARKVTMLVRGEKLSASQIAIDKVTERDSKIVVRYNTVVESFEGENSKLTTIRVHNKATGEKEALHPAAAFIFIGQQPNSGFAKETVLLDEFGYILTGHDLIDHESGQLSSTSFERIPLPFETSVPGIFAAGDVRHGATNQVASAVGEGAAAALSIRDFLKTV